MTRKKTRRNPTRRRRTAVARHRPNPAPRARRRTYRRNPAGVSAAGLVGMVTQGAVDAAEALGGKIAVNVVADRLGFQRGTIMRALVMTGAAVVAGFVASKVDRNAGKMVTAGGILQPMEDLAKQSKLPLVSTALGAYSVEDVLAGYADVYGAADEPNGAAQPALLNAGSVGDIGAYDSAESYAYGG